jgi:hypothetical protein
VHPETSKGQKAMEPPAKKVLPREVMALRSMGPDDNTTQKFQDLAR